ncbi:MAG: uroporphyrinogen decarboxylase family protein [Clostridia bacterium]
MNHRERFMAVLEGKEPDRIPILANLTIQAAEKLAPILGKEVGYVDSFLATRISHREILLELGNDAVIVAATRETPTQVLPNGDTRDEWGMVGRMVGLYGETVGRPLSACETIEDLDAYRFPDPLAPARWTFAQEMIAKYRADYAIVGDLEACLFELAWNLVGLEKFLMDLVCEEDYIEPLLDRVIAYSTACGLKMIELGVDMIWTGDDFGTQKGLMISKELWCKYFKPRYRKMFDAFRAANPNIKIAYHSCGSIHPLIEDYAQIGLDFLNPMQPAATDMELGKLYREFGNRLGFFGGVDVQDVLPNGRPEDVRAEVRRCMDAVNKSPRYIIAPAHNIQPDTAPENILAFFDEAIHYGVR